MSLIKSSQTIHVNSAFRQSGTDSDFIVNIPLKKNNRFTHVAIIDISVPKSYYLIPEAENTFIIRENQVDYTITIPAGNYNITSFIYVLNNLFQHTAGTNHYSVSFPDSKTEAQTGKMTFTHTNIQHTSEFIFGDNHLPEVMGFARGSTNQFVIGQTSSTLTSKNICNLQKESTIFVHSDMASDPNSDILIELFASGNPDLSNINLTSGDLEEHSKEFIGSQSNSFHFYITDEYKQNIDLNGVNVLITLLFYEKNTISTLMTGFIKYITMYLEEERSRQKLKN